MSVPRSCHAALALAALVVACAGGACDSTPPIRRDGGGASCTQPCTLAPGELLVTEVMYNPSGDDTTQEWFEIYNNSGRRIDSLTGVRVEVWTTDPAKSKTLRFPDENAPALETDGYLAVAKGSAPAGHPWSEMPALSNSAGTSFLVKCCDGTEISQLRYEATDPWPKLPTTGGVSLQLSRSLLERPARPDAKTAAEAKYWCAATDAQPYDGTNLGTPGAKNTLCAVKGECIANGTSRPVRTPNPGEVILTEIYPNPAGGDDYKEWIEVKALADVDLNDLVFVHTNENGNSKTNQVSSADCVGAAAGTYVVLGCSTNSTDSTQPDYNGGVNVRYAFASKQVLYNSACTLELQTADGQLLDSAQHPSPKEAVSLCLDEASSTWGHATTTGVFDGTGSPGNGACSHAP